MGNQCSLCRPMPVEEQQVLDRASLAAPTFQPLPRDSQMDAVTSCVRLALVSCGHVNQVKIEDGANGVSSALISAELSSGPCIFPRSYEVVQLAKRSLEAIASRLDN